MRANKRATRTARALFRLCLVDGTLDQSRVRLVTRRLTESGRRGVFPILSGFQRLVRLDRDRHAALVESAVPLSPAAKAEVERELSRAYGARLVTSFVEDPTLIGGMRIKVGSRLIDGSVRARLAALEARL